MISGLLKSASASSNDYISRQSPYRGTLIHSLHYIQGVSLRGLRTSDHFQHASQATDLALQQSRTGLGQFEGVSLRVEHPLIEAD